MQAKAVVAKKSSKRPSPRRKSAAADDVHLTHPDRVYWVDVGVTKQDLADYYRAVWDWMAPQIVGRPLALVRCPEGTKGQCFFQKHASAGLSDKTLHTVIDAKGRQVIAVEDLEGLISLVQAGVLEIHVRGAMIDRLDVCDRIVLDLDPGEGVEWSAMVAAARDVRERLDALKLESFVKLSGGKGLHVVLPIDGADWERAKTFAQALALAMAADEPDRYLAKNQVAAQGKDLRRLSAQLAGADFSGRLLDPGARRRAGLGPGRLDGARPHHVGQPVYRARFDEAARPHEAGPVEGYRAGAAEAAGRGGDTRLKPEFARRSSSSAAPRFNPAAGYAPATRHDPRTIPTPGWWCCRSRPRGPWRKARAKCRR
jgi:DNA ligase D-like protein (predicted polymerase)